MGRSWYACWGRSVRGGAGSRGGAGDQVFGANGKDVDLPGELDRREKRPAKPQSARAQIEAGAAERARKHAQEEEARRQDRAGTDDPEAVEAAGARAADTARPKDKAQANFTDPQFAIMKNGDGAYIQPRADVSRTRRHPGNAWPASSGPSPDAPPTPVAHPRLLVHYRPTHAPSRPHRQAMEAAMPDRSLTMTDGSSVTASIMAMLRTLRMGSPWAHMRVRTDAAVRGLLGGRPGKPPGGLSRTSTTPRIRIVPAPQSRRSPVSAAQSTPRWSSGWSTTKRNCWRSSTSPPSTALDSSAHDTSHR